MKPLNKTTVKKEIRPVKILQYGEGNFLRAFVDWMIDRANESGLMNHGITVVQPIVGSNNHVYDLFKRQDCLYHVYLEGIKDKQPIKEIHLVKSLADIVNPYAEYTAYEKLFLDKALEIIVSNTTEAGIRYEEGDDIFALPPASFPAKMTALLYKRYQKFKGAKDKGLLVVCCELIENNGSTLKKYILQHAMHNNLEAGFAAWINENCHFYDTLVDRIVPGFPKEDIDQIKAEVGFDDNLLVKGEYFHVWAIGGNPVIKERLPLNKAGLNVLFMNDITAFRAKKVRILNGSHTAMVPVALQLQCETVLDAFKNPLVEKYINCMVEEEVLPVIDEDPDELKKFSETILERFYNPFLKHYLKDISLNSLSKWEARNFPTVWDNYNKQNKKARLALFSFAAYLVLYGGKSEVNFIPNDTPEFVEFIRSTFNENDLNAWVSGIVNHKTMWNENFSQIPFFIDEVVEDVASILRQGMRQALENIISR